MFALSLMGAQVAACYTFDPTYGSTPRLGTQVAIDINDEGRVALDRPVAPEIGRIEGRLISADSSEYVIGITDLRSIRGMEQAWTGEQVPISRKYVSTMYEQHLSAVRTTVLAAAAVGVVALVANKALEGFSNAGQGPGNPGDTVPAIRIPAFRHPHLLKRW